MADTSGASQDKAIKGKTAEAAKPKRKADPRQVITTGVRVAFLAIFLFLVLNGKMPVWLGLFALSLVGATFFGRFFCGYACPMNTLMVPTDWLAKKMRLARRPAPAWLQGRYLPWVVLVLSLVSMMGLKRALGLDIPILLVLTGVAVTITFFYEPEVFHNRICPFGMLQKLGGRFARFSKTVDQDACVGCGLCVKACDSEAVQVRDRKAVITPAMCHQCQNCTVACPKNAISYVRVR